MGFIQLNTCFGVPLLNLRRFSKVDFNFCVYRDKCLDLERQLQDCENKFSDLEFENEELSSKLENVQANNQQDQIAITQLEEEIESKTMEFQREKELHQTAKTKLDSVTLEMNEILVKNLHLMTELSDNKSTIISLRTQINRLKSNAVKRSADTSIPDSLTASPIDSPLMAEHGETDCSNVQDIATQSSKIMSSELENLRNKCSALERELSALKKEQQSMTLSEQKDYNISTTDSEQFDAKNKQQKDKDKLVEHSDVLGLLPVAVLPSSLTTDSTNECETTSLKSTSSSDSFESDSMHRLHKQGKDGHIVSALAHENQSLKQKLVDLEASLEKQGRKEIDAAPRLQIENKRLLDLLQQAEKEAEDNQVQERVACIKHRVQLIGRYIKFFSDMHRTLGCVLFEKVKY